MALTPEDIVNKRFQSTKFREGYDQDEVDDFLDEVVVEMRRVAEENTQLKNELQAAEARIAELAEQEELGAMRPDLDGEQIMAILGIGPSRTVGEAYKYLLEMRIDEGPLGEEEATTRLRQWWATKN